LSSATNHTRQQEDSESELPSLRLCLTRHTLQGSKGIWSQSYLLLGHQVLRSEPRAQRPLCRSIYRQWLRTMDMPSSWVHGCLFNIFATNLYIYRPSGYPPPADAPHSRCQLPTLCRVYSRQPGLPQVRGLLTVDLETRRNIYSSCELFRTEDHPRYPIQNSIFILTDT